MLKGVVSAFDDQRGDGWLRVDNGEMFYFHCVEIADGTRNIAVGVEVQATRLLGHLGVDEAARLRVVD